MTITYTKTLITDEATDTDSPGTETLMQDYGQSINYLIDALFSGTGNSEVIGGISATAGDYGLIINPWNYFFIPGQSYVKTVEFKVPWGGEYRIRWQLRRDSGGTAFAKVYKNGSPVGIEKSTSSATYVNFSDDVSGFAGGDLLQIYTKHSGSTNIGIRNISISVDITDAIFGIAVLYDGARLANSYK